MSNNLAGNGYFAGGLATVFLVINQLLLKWFFTELDYNVWLFISIQYVFGGAALVTITGLKITGKDTLKCPHTWLMGMLRTLDSIFYGAALIYISATEASILMGFGKILVFVGSRAVFGYIIGKWRIPGLLLTLLPPVALGLQQQGGLLNPGVVFVILTCLVMTVEILLVEKHPTLHRLSLHDRYQSTGINMIISGLFFILLLFAGIFAGQYLISTGDSLGGVGVFITQSMPTLGQVMLPEMWLWGALTGIVVRAGYFFFRYFSIVRIKSHNYTLIITSHTFLLYAAESLLINMGILKAGMLPDNMLIYIVILTLGAVFCLGESWQTSLPKKMLGLLKR